MADFLNEEVRLQPTEHRMAAGGENQIWISEHNGGLLTDCKDKDVSTCGQCGFGHKNIMSWAYYPENDAGFQCQCYADNMLAWDNIASPRSSSGDVVGESGFKV